jgi:hypothetical protein
MLAGILSRLLSAQLVGSARDLSITSCKQDGWVSPYALCSVHPGLDTSTKAWWIGCQTMSQR